jgi:exo-beta-1,3-glucanase (GH17 family)
MTYSGQMSNVHPWFANVSIDQAAAWTNEFFEQQNVQPAAALTNNPMMYIAETGWPSVRTSLIWQCNDLLTWGPELIGRGE